MNNINNCENIGVDICKHKYEISSSEEGMIDKMLPIEVFQKILSYLNGKEILSTDLVSHYWNKNSIDMVQQADFFSRMDFVDFMVENLKEDSLKNELLELGADRSIFKLRSLKKIKLSTESSLEDIAKILTGLNEVNLTGLRQLYRYKACPNFDNLLAVVELFKDFCKVYDEEARLCKVKRLQKISMRLTVYRKIDKAVEVANAIPDDLQKALTLQGISDGLMQFGKMEKAIAVASTIAKDYVRTETLESIILFLFKSGHLERAIEVAHMILNYLDKSRVLSRLAEQLIKIGKLEEATLIAKGIPGSNYKNKILKDISLLPRDDPKLEFSSRDSIPVCDQKRAI